MKIIISASRRTDIPAFYLEWFMQAIKKGKITIQNPFYKKNFYEVELSPNSVEWIVFWSRNYSVFLNHRSFFNDYNLFFHFTILSNNSIIERKFISIDKALKQVEKIASCYGPDRIIWRYDPIVIWKSGNNSETNYRKKDFEYLCSNMSQTGIKNCYFSFVSTYSKFLKRFNKAYPDFIVEKNSLEVQNKILDEMIEIASHNKITLFSCCNDLLVRPHIKKGSCISGKLLNSLLGKKTVSEAKSPTRKNCGCTRSIDIGNYVTQPCYFGCIYCYANPKYF